MAKDRFAGGWYDFSKAFTDEGVIVAFKDKKQARKFFIERDDHTEELIELNYDLDARVGHRVKLIGHEDVGYLGHRIFETRSYMISRNALRRTFTKSDLPPYGRNIYRISGLFLIAFFIGWAVVTPEDFDPDLPISMVQQALLTIGAIAMFVFSGSLIFVKSFKEGKAIGDFIEQLHAEYKERLYGYEFGD